MMSGFSKEPGRIGRWDSARCICILEVSVQYWRFRPLSVPVDSRAMTLEQSHRQPVLHKHDAHSVREEQGGTRLLVGVRCSMRARVDRGRACRIEIKSWKMLNYLALSCLSPAISLGFSRDFFFTTSVTPSVFCTTKTSLTPNVKIYSNDAHGDRRCAYQIVTSNPGNSFNYLAISCISPAISLGLPVHFFLRKCQSRVLFCITETRVCSLISNYTQTAPINE